MSAKAGAAASIGGRKNEPPATATRGLNRIPTRRRLGRELFQQLEPFSAHRRFDIGEAGGVAAGPGEACGELLAERIGRRDENDRDRAGLGKQGSDRSRAPGEEHVRLQAHQLLAGSGEAVPVTGRETIIDAEVRPVGPAEALHGFEERRSLGSPLRIVFAGGHKNAEPAELARLLRACAERPCGSAAPITAMTSRRLMRSPRRQSARGYAHHLSESRTAKVWRCASWVKVPVGERR